MQVNPNDKFLDWSKLKAFADDKIILTQKLKFLLGTVENIVGKGENAGNQHFLLLLHVLKRLLTNSKDHKKSGLCGKGLVLKGEIACNKQFLLFPQCFQKTSTADT